MQEHLLIKHNLSVVCSVCYVRFSDRELFLQHLKEEQKNKSFTCTCETCGATFQSKQALKKHISWNHEIHKKVPCNYCGVIVQNMKMHVENRHENSFESCWHCDFQTRRSSSMKKHVKNLHTETSLKTCEFCGVLRKNLSRHLERTKCGEGKSIDQRKSEKCTECGKLFTTKDHLSHHIKGVHLKIKNNEVSIWR